MPPPPIPPMRLSAMPLPPSPTGPPPPGPAEPPTPVAATPPVLPLRDVNTARSGFSSDDDDDGPPSPLPPPGSAARGLKLSLDLSKLKNEDASSATLGGDVAKDSAEELRNALKLDFSTLGGGSDAAGKGASGELKPNWEFDLNEITLGHRIGAGAFGEVYEASWRRSRIAVKRLLCQRITDGARREFMAEMSLMSNLRHPHIVRFLGACLEPLQMSILFELCSASLYGVLHVQKQPLQLEYALSLIRQIGLGIFYLHQCKEPVLHLDLKSANVLLDEHGVAKVADFGLSHIKKETAVITARMGSPQWTAPEILRGQPHDESADTYSFGVLLYEIMAAKLPYEGIDTFQVVMGVITKMLPRPELPPDCPFPQLSQELMFACWRETPSERPKFNAILDKADEALEHLALRPQLAGAGAKSAAHAIATDLFAKARSPPGSKGSADSDVVRHSHSGSSGATLRCSGSHSVGYCGSAGSAGAVVARLAAAAGHTHHGVHALHSGGVAAHAPLAACGHASGSPAGATGSGSGGRPLGRVAVALVDHVGQAFEELSFKRGDTIRHVERSAAIPASPASPLASLSAAEGGLWRGTLRGRSGHFRGSHVVMSTETTDGTIAKDGGVLFTKDGANVGSELQPHQLLRELREAEEMLQAKDIQVAALKAMKKREEQTKLLDRTTRRMLSRHLDGWRRVVVDARADRAMREKDAEIEELLKRVRELNKS